MRATAESVIDVGGNLLFNRLHRSCLCEHIGFAWRCSKCTIYICMVMFQMYNNICMAMFKCTPNICMVMFHLRICVSQFLTFAPATERKRGHCPRVFDLSVALITRRRREEAVTTICTNTVVKSMHASFTGRTFTAVSVECLAQRLALRFPFEAGSIGFTHENNPTTGGPCSICNEPIPQDDRCAKVRSGWSWLPEFVSLPCLVSEQT